ncbi:hypothetical protein GGI43DRAFT_3878 [Trichoderma evansii]
MVHKNPNKKEKYRIRGAVRILWAFFLILCGEASVLVVQFLSSMGLILCECGVLASGLGFGRRPYRGKKGQ